MNITVTTLSDAVGNDGVTSLREAVALANADADHNTITFADGLTGTVAVASSLELLTDVTILADSDGNGAGDVTLIGRGGGFTVVRVLEGDATIRGLDITNSRNGIYIDEGATLDFAGGAIYGNERSGVSVGTGAVVVVANATISGNLAAGIGVSSGAQASITGSVVTGNNWSGIRVSHGASATVADTIIADTTNSGIYNQGTISATGLTLSNNSAGLYNSGHATLTNSSTFENSLGVGNEGSLTVSGVTIFDNATGISNNGFGRAAVENVTLVGNEVGVINADGASASLVNLTITGNDTGVVQAVGQQSSTGSVSLSNSLVVGNAVVDMADPLVRAENNLIGGDASMIFAEVDANGAGVLADNGGTIRTVALSDDANNPALDVTVDAPATDARGAERDGATDLGAFELGGRLTSIIGTENSETILGFDNDNTLWGQAGNDVLSGGAGHDMALYAGAHTGFALAVAADGTLAVRDIDAMDGNEGIDTLKADVEGVRFADGWTAIIRSQGGEIDRYTLFDEAGRAIMHGFTNANGNRVEVGLDLNRMASRTIHDDTDAFGWDTLAQTFENGAMTGRAFTFAGAEGNETAGVAVTIANGETTSRTITQGDGDIAQFIYSSSGTTTLFTDGAGDNGWMKRELTRDAGGVLVEQRLIFSNEVAAKSGTQIDANDDYAWETREFKFDANDDLVCIDYTY